MEDKQQQGIAEENSSELISDSTKEGRDDYFMDIDRMINEGLGGGNVTLHNGLIEESTTDTIDNRESLAEEE